MPRRRGYVTINSKAYRLAPLELGRGPAIQFQSAGKDLLSDLRRKDIVPVRGGMPGEFWFFLERFDGGAAPKGYMRRWTHFAKADSEALADSRFGMLVLDTAPLSQLTWTAENADVWGVFEEDNDLLVGNGTAVQKLASSVTEDVDISATDADATPFNVVNWNVGGADVALTGTGSHIFQRSAGSWTNDATATEYIVVGPDRLWKSYQSSGTYFVAACLANAAPLTAANWSSGIRIGHSGIAITGLAILGDELLVASTIGLLGTTRKGVVFNRTPAVAAHSNNGRGTLQAFGYIWYPTRDNGLFAYRDNVVFPDQGPDAITDEPRAHGYIQTLYEMGGWLIAVVDYNNTKSLWRARLRRPGDEAGGLLKWFFWRYSWATSAYYAAMLESDEDIGAATARMLWVVRDGAADGFFRPDFAPFTTTEVILPPAAGLANTGVFHFPQDDLGFPWAQKILRSAVVVGRQIDSTRKVEFFGEMDEGSAWAALSLTSSGVLGTMPTSNTTGRIMTDAGLRLYDSAAGTSGPVVDRFGLRFFVRPDNDRVFTLRLILEDRSTRENRAIPEDAETQVTNLLALAENQAIISFGESTTDYTVLVSSEMGFSIIGDDKRRRPRWLGEVQMSII